MPNPETIYRLSDNIIEVTGVKNVATGAYLNSANVDVTLVDASSGAEVSGQTWPMALSYVAGSDGDYRGTITDAISIDEGQTLIAKVTVDGGAGLKRYWEKTCIAYTGS